MANQDSTLLRIQKPGSLETGSTGLTKNGSDQQRTTFQNNLTMSHKFNDKGRSFSLSINQSKSLQKQRINLYTAIQIKSPPSLNIVDQETTAPVTSNNFNMHSTYQEPINKNFKFRLQYDYSGNQNKSDKKSYDYDANTNQYDLQDPLTTDNFINDVTTQQLRAAITGSHIGQYNFNLYLGVGLQISNQLNNNLTNHSTNNLTYHNLLPNAEISISPNRNELLSIDYQGYSQSPTIDQLQPLPDLSNPYLLKLGNPDLQQSFTHVLRTLCNFFDTNILQSIQFVLQGSIIQNQISNANTTLAGGTQQIEYVNLNGVYHLDGNVTYSFPLIKQENGTGRISAGFQYGHDRGITDNQINTNRNNNYITELSIAFHHNKNLFINLSAGVRYQANHYEQTANLNAHIFLQNDGVDLTYELPRSMAIGFNYYYQYSITGGLPSHETHLLNSFISKGIFKGNHAQVRLSGFNLLDAATTVNQITGTNYIATTKTNTLHPLVILSLVNNFNKFGSAK